MKSSDSKRRVRKSGARHVALVLLSTFIPVALLAWGVTASVKAPQTDPGTTASIVRDLRLEIAGEKLSIPRNMVRFHSARNDGNAEQVDLLLKWPGLVPYSEEFDGTLSDGRDGSPLLHASIGIRDNPSDSDGMLEPLYRQFFAGAASDVPAGLQGAIMATNSAYSGEIIYFSENNQPSFVTRCLVTNDAVADTCMRKVHIGSRLSLLYRFHRSHLSDWRKMDEEIRNLVNGFLVRG